MTFFTFIPWTEDFFLIILRIIKEGQVSGYKYKIGLISILRKREDQSLISISTILRFSAQGKLSPIRVKNSEGITLAYINLPVIYNT